jgi:hypothetical protein
MSGFYKWEVKLASGDSDWDLVVDADWAREAAEKWAVQIDSQFPKPIVADNGEFKVVVRKVDSPPKEARQYTVRGWTRAQYSASFDF